MKIELNEKEFEMMITAFRRIFMNENEVIEVDRIDQTNYNEYIGKTVKVTGDVNLRDLGLTKIPINFTEVGGSFDCGRNKLTSLEGVPRKVGGSFDCGRNKLTSLEGAPRKVGGSFYCDNNELTSLEGSPEKVRDTFNCSYNKLTSLEGAPEKVDGNFGCWCNPLKSTKGIPEYIGGIIVS